MFSHIMLMQLTSFNSMPVFHLVPVTWGVRNQFLCDHRDLPHLLIGLDHYLVNQFGLLFFHRHHNLDFFICCHRLLITLDNFSVRLKGVRFHCGHFSRDLDGLFDHDDGRLVHRHLLLDYHRDFFDPFMCSRHWGVLGRAHLCQLRYLNQSFSFILLRYFHLLNHLHIRVLDSGGTVTSRLAALAPFLPQTGTLFLVTGAE